MKKKQSALLKQIIKDVDPNAFTYINKAKEVSGFGFRNAAAAVIKEAEDQHCEDRSDRAERHETEAVRFGILIASYV